MTWIPINSAIKAVVGSFCDEDNSDKKLVFRNYLLMNKFRGKYFDILNMICENKHLKFGLSLGEGGKH